MNERDLYRLKEQLEASKTKLEQLRGRRNYLLSQLVKNWKCDTVAGAKIQAKKLEARIALLNEQIQKSLTELEASLEEQTNAINDDTSDS